MHGTTLATNVVLERRGSDIAFVTTAGFGDMLRLGRESRQDDDRFNLFFQTPAPPVPRARTFEVTERIDARGNVVVALDAAHATDVARRVAESGARGVAICLLHAYAHPAHEEVVAAACRAALPEDAFVITSSEVWPEIREYERAMTTVMCAYVGPIMARYLADLETRLTEMGIGCPIEIMESSGGVMSASLASRRPIYTVESGGAAGIIAAGVVGRAHRCRPGALLRHGRHHGQDRHRPPGPPRYHARLPCRRKGRQRRPAPGTGVSRSRSRWSTWPRWARAAAASRRSTPAGGSASGPGRRARSRDRPATGGAEPSRPSPMPTCSWGTSVRATSPVESRSIPS